MRIANLPRPSTEDIKILPSNRILPDRQRRQLCSGISRTFTKGWMSGISTVEAMIAFEDGTVETKIIG